MADPTDLKQERGKAKFFWNKKLGALDREQFIVRLVKTGQLLFLHGQDVDERKPANDAGGVWAEQGEDGPPRERVAVRPGNMFGLFRDIQRVLGASGTFQIDGSLYAMAATVDGTLAPTRLLTRDTICCHVSQFVDLGRWCFADGSRKWNPMDMPRRHASEFVEEKSYPDVPVFAGIAEQPFLRPDGSVCHAAGYDAETQMFCAFDGSRFPVIANPNRADAEAALERIKGLFDEVPFDTESDRAAAVSACLTSAVRRGLPSAPAFLHTAHAEGSGSGKNYSEGMIERFATEGNPTVMDYGRKTEELDKMLFAALLEFPKVLRFDELELGTNFSGSPKLLNMLTEPFVTDRVLGLSRVATVPTGVLVQLSGNAVSVVKDMRRRVVAIYYSPEDDHKYTKEPRLLLEANRERFVADALTIIRAYLLAEDKTMVSTPFKGFNRWDRWCRQPLCWLGMEDPAGSLIDNISTTDGGVVDHDAVDKLLKGLYEKFGNTPFLAKDAAEYVRITFRLGEVVSLIVGEEGNGKQMDAVLVGKALSMLRGMKVGQLRVRRKNQSERSKKPRKWFITSA